MVLGPSARIQVAVHHIMDRLCPVVDVFLRGASTPPFYWCVDDRLSQGGPIGRAFDVYGPAWPLSLGSVILVSSLIGTSFCVEYYQYLLVQGFGFGLGVAMLCVFVHSCALSSNLTVV